MRGWETGRAKITPEQREEAEQRQKERVRIANMVSRKPEIKKECCLCGKPGNILHNKTDNPYYITFLCNECRKNESNISKAEKYRFDLRTKLDKSYLSAKTFAEQDVKQLISEFLSSILSLGEFCDEKGLSRHQFNKIIERYDSMDPEFGIRKRIKIHSNKIQENKLRTIVENKAIYVDVTI